MRASDFADLVPGCCAEVLDAMYFTSLLEPGGAEIDREIKMPILSAGDLAFGLEFSGDISGRFGLHVDASTAGLLAANFLGEDAESLTGEQVEEVVGELSNMLCGSVLSRVDARRKFVLSHPRLLDAAFGDPAPETGATKNQDLLVTRLDTDSGVVTTWVSVDWVVLHPVSARSAR